MKAKRKITIVIAGAVLAVALSVPTYAAEIPIESAPANADETTIAITENLIGGILEEVANGLGYGEAQGKASNIIYSALLAGETGGLGYADMMAAARNALFQYRDMYLRPDYYAEAEEAVKALIPDLINAVAAGTKDYRTARDEAYIRILQAADPAFSMEDVTGDFCYWNLPTIDSVKFNRARKLLLEAKPSIEDNL